MSSLTDVQINEIEIKSENSLKKNLKTDKDSFVKIYPKKDDFCHNHLVYITRPNCNKITHLKAKQQVFYNFHNYYVFSISRGTDKTTIVLISGQKYS